MCGSLAVVAIAAFAPAAASAHAIVVRARPAMNATVPQGDLDIKLDFNSRIDARRSRLSLIGPDGSPAPVASVGDAGPNALAGRARATMAGQWKLRWQVLSLDGHVTRGEVSFSVGNKPSAP
jgi:methionine-rich copper-binding protein CopC